MILRWILNKLEGWCGLKKKLVEDKGQWQDFVKTVMKLHVPYKAGNNSTR